MKRLLLASAFAGSMMLAAAPAQAVTVFAGTSGNVPSPFAAILLTQGTQIASTTVSGSTETFSGTMRSAVYRNTLGTLDFYYQVTHDGPGSLGASDEITSFTAGNYAGFDVDAHFSELDPDLGGFFLASNNQVSTATIDRNGSGGTLTAVFGLNDLFSGETTGTFVYRTNAASFTTGTFGLIDGSTLDGMVFAPGAVPEPATWLMMIGGFGLVGAAMRRRRRTAKIAFA